MDKKELLDNIVAMAEELKKNSAEKSEEMLKTDEECKVMLKLSERIVDTILEEGLIKDDMKGWPSIVMLALGRATAIILSSLDHVHATGFMPAEIMYERIVLPASLGIIQSHVEKRAKAKSQEEEDGEGDS